jgi:hypothetical protein
MAPPSSSLTTSRTSPTVMAVTLAPHCSPLLTDWSSSSASAPPCAAPHRRFASTMRPFPTAVNGPVESLPGSRHRPEVYRSRHLHGVPFRVFALHVRSRQTSGKRGFMACKAGASYGIGCPRRSHSADHSQYARQWRRQSTRRVACGSCDRGVSLATTCYIKVLHQSQSVRLTSHCPHGSRPGISLRW